MAASGAGFLRATPSPSTNPLSLTIKPADYLHIDHLRQGSLVLDEHGRSNGRAGRLPFMELEPLLYEGLSLFLGKVEALQDRLNLRFGEVQANLAPTTRASNAKGDGPEGPYLGHRLTLPYLEGGSRSYWIRSKTSILHTIPAMKDKNCTNLRTMPRQADARRPRDNPERIEE